MRSLMFKWIKTGVDFFSGLYKSQINIKVNIFAKKYSWVG